MGAKLTWWESDDFRPIWRPPHTRESKVRKLKLLTKYVDGHENGKSQVLANLILKLGKYFWEKEGEKREKKVSSASAGNRTRVNCLEGSYANHYTTDASYSNRLKLDFLNGKCICKLIYVWIFQHFWFILWNADSLKANARNHHTMSWL